MKICVKEITEKKIGFFIVVVLFVRGFFFIWGNFTSCFFFQSDDKWVYAFKKILFFLHINMFLQKIFSFFPYNNIQHLFSFSILLHYKCQSKMSFISNNVKGLQAISKRIKIFEYLKNYVTSNGFIFLQETHSSVKDEKIWNDEFE